MASGIYIDYSFADLLGLETRALIGILATLYALVRLVPWVKNMQRMGRRTTP
ncbi:MAG: hypothetical protein OEV49_01900 [candidate division Zixibacteria bacterium]|nr:hypothetical protein [candidate division Zixibacteria bacterium]MDH3938745.1 hypothetical protein [candidate division Zixibacteria bacterium]MDH4033319.1 hypothetical protein [candidate division Zixibacteria bacterium]